MQRASSRPVKTFSIGFDDPAFDETPLRRAGRDGTWGPSTTPSSSSPGPGRPCPALAWQFDEPFADSSALPTWHVARETRRHVTVALTGDAGDELFAGYDRYRAVALAALLDRLPGRPAAVPRRAGRPGLAGLGAGRRPGCGRSAGCSKGSASRPRPATSAGSAMFDEPGRGRPLLRRLARRTSPRPARATPPRPTPPRSSPAPSPPPRGATRSPGRWSPTS